MQHMTTSVYSITSQNVLTGFQYPNTPPERAAPHNQSGLIISRRREYRKGAFIGWNKSHMGHLTLPWRQKHMFSFMFQATATRSTTFPMHALPLPFPSGLPVSGESFPQSVVREMIIDIRMIMRTMTIILKLII